MSYPVINNQPAIQDTSKLGNRYLIKQEVSRSQAYSLYRAVEIENGRVIALKIFRRKFSADPRFALKFRSLLKTIFRIEDEHLVSILDYGIEDGYYYIASEWIEGQDLGAYLLKIGSLSEVQTIAIGSQVCQALDVIHQNNMLHQNIKPQNILLSSNGQVKLSDVGLSGLISESGLSRTHVMLGRYHYIAPEQVNGQETTPESDLYSLGIVMYEMLTGQYPFNSQDVWEVLRMHIESNPPSLDRFPQKVSAYLARIIHRALQKSPSMRFSSANEMNAALTAVLVESVPPQIDFSSTATTGFWEEWNDWVSRGKAFLQGPAPFRVLGKRISFALMLLIQFAISFLVVFIFLTSAFTLSKQIRQNQNLFVERFFPTNGSFELEKSRPKMYLEKQSQGSLEYHIQIENRSRHWRSIVAEPSFLFDPQTFQPPGN